MPKPPADIVNLAPVPLQRMLGIETSTTRGAIAIQEGDRFVAAAPLPEGSRPTASLVPAIAELCRAAGWPLRSIGTVAVDIGPGSYTGLRVGLTCAKTLAFAAGGAVVAVRSLDVVARNAPPESALAEVAFDAVRGQVFCGRYRHEGGRWLPIGEVQILPAAAWASATDPCALVLGPALVRYADLVPAGRQVAPPDLWWPRAKAVIEIAREQPPAPAAADWTLEPLYMRPSAAEEKRQGG